MMETQVYEGEDVTSVGYLGKKLLIGTSDAILLCDKKKPTPFVSQKRGDFSFMQAFPDGSRLATHYGKRGVLLDASTKEIIQTWNVKGETHGSFALSPNGKRMVGMGCDEGGSGVVLEVGVEKPIARFGGQRYGAVVFLDDNQFACAASHGHNQSTLSIYDLTAKKPVELAFGQFKPRVSTLVALGGVLFGATDDGLLQFQVENQIGYNDKAPTTTLLKGKVNDLAMSGDNLVAATQDGVFLIEPKTKKATQLSKHSAVAVQVSPSAESIAFTHDTSSGTRKVFELRG